MQYKDHSQIYCHSIRLNSLDNGLWIKQFIQEDRLWIVLLNLLNESL